MAPMGPFMPLFSLELEHSYFPDGRCRGLQWQPSAHTTTELERTGCLLRSTPQGLLVLLDHGCIDALRLRAGQTHEPLRFDFLARVADPYFANYTDAVFGQPKLLLVGSSQAAQREDDTGRWRLHAEPHAGRAELRKLATPAMQHLLSRGERRAPPHFAVSITVGPAEVQQALADDIRRYVMRFRARSTVWKYCLLGDWAEGQEDANLQVVDLTQACRFDTAASEQLPGGRTLLAVRSSEPIALQERPDRRFQLRRQGGNGSDKVLVKRLPMASPQHLHRETVGGQPALVSEIYVHR